jgi:hypothetical protein
MYIKGRVGTRLASVSPYDNIDKKRELSIIDKGKATKAENKQVLLFSPPTFSSAKAKDGGYCLPLRINPDVLPTCFG